MTGKAKWPFVVCEMVYVKCEPLLMFQGKPSRPVSVQWVPANDTVWGKDPSESCPTCICAISGKEWVRRNPRAWSSVDFELSARDVFMVVAGKLEMSKLIPPVVRWVLTLPSQPSSVLTDDSVQALTLC